MTKLRSLNERNDARAAIRDEDYHEAIGLALIALYDLALEYLRGDLKPRERPASPRADAP